MHQRQAGQYARRFDYGSHTHRLKPILESLATQPGIGLIPPEFDDLVGGELDTVEALGNHEANVSE